MILFIHRAKDGAVFEVLFDSEDHDRIKPFSWWVVEGVFKESKALFVKGRGASTAASSACANQGNRPGQSQVNFKR